MSKYVCKIDPAQIVAIDVHTHAETSARVAARPRSMIFDEAMAKYFKEAGRPTIPQVAQYYRERKMAAVIFTVDTEADIGIRRSPTRRSPSSRPRTPTSSSLSPASIRRAARWACARRGD